MVKNIILGSIVAQLFVPNTVVIEKLQSKNIQIEIILNKIIDKTIPDGTSKQKNDLMEYLYQPFSSTSNPNLFQEFQNQLMWSETPDVFLNKINKLFARYSYLPNFDGVKDVYKGLDKMYESEDLSLGMQALILKMAGKDGNFINNLTNIMKTINDHNSSLAKELKELDDLKDLDLSSIQKLLSDYKANLNSGDFKDLVDILKEYRIKNLIFNGEINVDQINDLAKNSQVLSKLGLIFLKMNKIQNALVISIGAAAGLMGIFTLLLTKNLIKNKTKLKTIIFTSSTTALLFIGSVAIIMSAFL